MNNFENSKPSLFFFSFFSKKIIKRKLELFLLSLTRTLHAFKGNQQKQESINLAVNHENKHKPFMSRRNLTLKALHIIPISLFFNAPDCPYSPCHIHIFSCEL